MGVLLEKGILKQTNVALLSGIRTLTHKQTTSFCAMQNQFMAYAEFLSKWDGKIFIVIVVSNYAHQNMNFGAMLH